MKLSVIITASSEGILAHKTILSVLGALKNVGVSYEIIIAIDNGTEETKAYFSRYADDKHYRIIENGFKDVGESRNSAIERAKGEFVFLLDADDLISDDYFTKGLEVLEKTEQETVVHPEYCLTFEDCGARCVLQRMGESFSQEKDTFLLLSRNRWVSALGGQRKTFLKHPYISTAKGYGHEDYALNIALTEAGVKHRVARNTVYFYRRKQTSLLMLNSANFCTQPYTELFSVEKWQKMEIPEAEFPELAPPTTRQKVQNLYVKIRQNKVLNALITPAATLGKRLTGKKLVPEAKIPEAVMERWRAIAKIESQLYPVVKLTDSLAHYTAENYSKVSEAYWKMCQQVEGMPNYVFVVPWVVSGGSDKVLLNYLAALKEIHSEWKVAVITTVPVENEWRGRMADNSYLIDFGNITKGLSWDDQELLFTRLMVQLRVKKLHIINSEFGYAWARLHPELVKSQIELYVSLFCHGILSKTNCEGTWDFADPNASRIYHLIEKIYTDNMAVVKKLVAEDGFDEEKIVAHHQPAKLANINRKKKTEDGKLRILWASRISVQKNPRLLVRIARKLNPENVLIDAYGRIDPIESENFAFPKDLKTLTYCGKFDGLDSLDLSKYDVLLYTSRIDGMPNIILEAASAGLATIASNVGGISDFIKDGETGILVNDADNEDAYIEVIDRIRQDPGVLEKLAKAAREKVKKDFSWQTYIETIKKDFN